MKKNNLYSRREFPVYSLKSRIINYIKSSQSGSLKKPMSSTFVQLGPRKFKRVCCIDSWASFNMCRLLEQVSESGYFPQAFLLHENELWVEYIEGTVIQNTESLPIQEFGNLYSYLYNKDFSQVSAESHVRNLVRDLSFLHDMSIISTSNYGRLNKYKDIIAPDHVWVGMDYTDSILKNFLIHPDSRRLFAIDIGSLQDNKLIGTGLAKARIKWLDQAGLELILNQMRQDGTPDFYEYFDFIQLCFRAAWLKSIFVRKKWKKLDSQILEELL